MFCRQVSGRRVEISILMLFLLPLLELQDKRNPVGIDKAMLSKIVQAGEVNIEEDLRRLSARR